ncbi:hypothetical protein GIB67_017061 [Kingdonia uniflora]|uniref:Protein kinase domain-containing protein n=1 Tax=Kingdonia uniflora TaxID=39325 RepID=A0A7J7NDB5_9MAGN|nr:hypothetical protein GIB67_017061 [Kingdonia uniflora]
MAAAAALECWSGRANTDDDVLVEQVLMSRSHDRSEGGNPLLLTSIKESSSVMQKKFQKLSKNFSEAITNLKNSLNLDSSVRETTGTTVKMDSCRKLVWGGVVRNLTELYPGSQLPEKLISNMRKHFDSLPISYAQANFDMKDVFNHIRLFEQATIDEHPAILIQKISDDETYGSVYKLTFACNSSVSWPVMSGALDNVSICCKKIQIFDRKGSTLGIIHVLVQSGQEKSFRNRIETALKSALKKPKSTTMKLPFGLCGCQEENTRGQGIGDMDENDECSYENDIDYPISKVQLEMPLPSSSFVVAVDEWQTIRSGGDDIGRWLLSSDEIEFAEQIGSNSFKGVFKGRRVAIEKLRGCEKGNSYEFELRKDLLALMSCGHKSILQFYGLFINDTHGLCLVTKMMEGASVHEVIQKGKKIQLKEITRISVDVAEGLKFMNDHGVSYKDLNTQRILLDRQGNACIGNMDVAKVCSTNGEVRDYETDGYRWLAPEIIAGDPESVTETWMSNVYSFGMVLWEMITGEAAYSTYSPVQAAVGIAACGLRPDIPKDCPQTLRSLMMKCWNSSPSKRPQFSEIITILLRSNYNR